MWIGGFGFVGFCFVLFFFFFCCDWCLKEEVGMAELGMTKVGRGSLKFGVGRGLWWL